MSDNELALDPGIVVLLVDDQPMIGEAVRRALLADTGIRFHFCANPAEALESAAALGPDVILQDLVMPGVDGLTLVRAYGADPRTTGVPIVVLSSKEDPKVKSEAFAAGAHDYLVKLPDRIELIARVRHHGAAHQSRLQRDAAYRALAANEQLLSQRNGELEQLNQRLAGAQTQLLQAEKMASVGQLAAGVAHEINNPMGFVNSNLRTLQRYQESMLVMLEAYEQLEASISDGRPELAQLRWLKQRIDIPYMREELESLFPETLDGIARVIKIVGELREFSHLDVNNWEPVELRHGIESTLNLIGYKLRETAEVSCDFGELPLVECLASQINQVFLNVLSNALEAIPEGGHIYIRTYLDGTQAVVCIADDGRGIVPAQLQRVFEPFYTTKPVGSGTGLGLSVAYGTMQQHGGSIELASELGKGTQVTLRLPITRLGK